MPRAKELTVTIEDKPGALARCFSALAERGVNILAFQSFVEGRESLMRLVVDDTAAASAVLGGLRMIFEETDVVTVRLRHEPGQLGRATECLGKNQINIDYSYSGVEASGQPFAVFGVDSLTKAATALDQLTA